jgi:hypothetical protein
MSGGRERSEDGSAKAPPRLRALQIYLCGTEQEPCVMCGLFPSEYTIYVIMVLWEGVEWQIRKRYSEFRYLHDFLLSKFGNRLGTPVSTSHRLSSCVPTVSRLPQFPGKSYNPITHKAPSFIETRAGELALWLQSLCVYKEVIANPSFIDWMEMPQEVSRVCIILHCFQRFLPRLCSPFTNVRILSATMRALRALNRKAPVFPAHTYSVSV